MKRKVSVPSPGRQAPPCPKCGKPRRVRRRNELRNNKGYFYAHDCEDCRRKYMLKYWNNRKTGNTLRGMAEKKAKANSLRTLKILHRALTGVELAR